MRREKCLRRCSVAWWSGVIDGAVEERRRRIKKMGNEEKGRKRNVEKSMDGLVELEWRKGIAEDVNDMKNRRC